MCCILVQFLFRFITFPKKIIFQTVGRALSKFQERDFLNLMSVFDS